MEPAVTLPGPAPLAAPPPLTIGRLLDRTFRLWRENAAALAALVLLIQLPSLVLSLAAGPTPEPGVVMVSGSRAARFLELPVSLFLFTLSQGALTAGALRALNGERPRTGELLAFAVRSFWRVLAVTMNAGLRLILWTLLLVVPGIVAACRMFVAVPASVAEPGLSSSEAIARSAQLTAGRRLHLFAAVLLLEVLATAVNVAILTVGEMPFGVATLVTWVIGTIAGSLGSTAAGVAYHDLRLEKEGGDTAQLAAVFD